MTGIRYTVVFPALLVGAVQCLAQGITAATPASVGMSKQRLDRIGPAMQKFVDDGIVPGVVSAVMRHGKLVHVDAVGYRDVAGKVSMTRDTIFRLYSCTKPITAVAALILYEEGRFSLFDPISQYLPEFEGIQVYVSGGKDDPQVEPPRWEPVIMDLLKHTSGLTRSWGTPVDAIDSLYKEADLANREIDLAEYSARLSRIPLRYQPATKFGYGVSTTLLGYLVQVVSGQPLDEFIQERILDPLEMVDTGFYVPPEKLDRFAANYVWSATDGLVPFSEAEPPDYTFPPKLITGGGGLVSTVDDYLRFCQMLLNGGEIDGARVLAPSTVRFMTTNQLFDGQTRGGGVGYGLGIHVLLDPVRDGRVGNAGQFFADGAAQTYAWIDPKEDLIYLLWTQRIPISGTFAQRQGWSSTMHPLVYSAVEE